MSVTMLRTDHRTRLGAGCPSPEAAGGAAHDEVRNRRLADRIRWQSWLFALACSALLPHVAWAQPAAAPDHRSEANRHFQLALRFSEQGSYAEALVELQRAYQAAPHFAVLYNIGQVHVALGNP